MADPNGVLRYATWNTAEQAGIDQDAVAAAIEAAERRGERRVRAAVEALADRGRLLNDDFGRTVRAIEVDRLRAAVAPAQPADGER